MTTNVQALRSARTQIADCLVAVKRRETTNFMVFEPDDRRVYANVEDIRTSYNHSTQFYNYTVLEVRAADDGGSDITEPSKMEWGTHIVVTDCNHSTFTVRLKAGHRWFDFDAHRDVNEVILRFTPRTAEDKGRAGALVDANVPPFATIRRVPSLSGAELLEAEADGDIRSGSGRGGQVLCICGSGLRGALKCDMLFVPPLFEYADYEYISTFPLVEEDVRIRLRGNNSRLHGASGPLRAIAIDTGGGLIAVDDADGGGVVLLEDVGVLTADYDVARLAASPVIDYIHSVRAETQHIKLSEWKPKIYAFFDNAAKQGNAWLPQQAEQQLFALDSALTAIHFAHDALLKQPLAPAALCQTKAMVDFGVWRNAICMNMQNALQLNIATIQHFLYHAASLGVDFVFFSSLRGTPDVVFDNGINYSCNNRNTNFASRDFKDVATCQATADFISRRAQIYLTDNQIAALETLLREPQKDLLMLVKAALIEAGYHVGSSGHYPIIVSLWGHNSPQVLPIDVVALNPDCMAKWLHMQLYAPEYCDYATLRLVAKPRMKLKPLGADANSYIGTRLSNISDTIPRRCHAEDIEGEELDRYWTEEGPISSAQINSIINKDAVELPEIQTEDVAEAESRPHTEARSVQTSPYSPPPRTQPTHPGSSGSSSKKNKKKGRRGVLYSIRRLINFRKQEQPSSK